MSAFIRLNKQDAFVVPYTAHKSFSLPYFGDSGSAGVEFYVGTRDRTSLFSSASLKTRNQYSSLVFDSINHLYYSNFSSSVESGSYENYNQSTLFYSRSLTLTDNSDIFVVDIRRDRFGEAIKPSSFTYRTGSITIADDGEGNLQTTGDTTLVITEYTFHTESVEVLDIPNSLTIQFTAGVTIPANYTFVTASWTGTPVKSPFLTYIGDISVQTVTNDGLTLEDVQGYLYTTGDPTYYIGGGNGETMDLIFVSSSLTEYTIPQDTRVGNIFYPHGIAVINRSPELVTLLKDSVGYGTNVNWQASHTIFQHQYRCRVNESSLNYSQNPSIKSGSNGDTYNFATGSYFQPYITTVGLYNDSNELIAVAKLGQPIPKSRYTDMTFVIALDI